eukprot:jgi/Mesvir1/18345/Mv14244-RA.1
MPVHRQSNKSNPRRQSIMEAILQYRGDDSEEEPEDTTPVTFHAPKVSAAPPVHDTALGSAAASDQGRVGPQYHDPSSHVVRYNPTVEQLWAPVAGPAHPFYKDGLSRGVKNHKTGFVEDAHISHFNFDEQFNTFQARGYAADPGGGDAAFVGDEKAVKEYKGESVYTGTKRKAPASSGGDADAGGSKKAVDIASEDWITQSAKSPWAGKKEVVPQELTEEQKAYLEAKEQEAGSKKKASKEHVDRSTFHGGKLKDYQGRSWMAPPRDVKKMNEHTFLPKALVHTWSGHTKGVNAIRFFPKTGHLLLSASMDTKVKIWDVHGTGKCMRDYMGHTESVRDICFSNDGSRFLSASYDRKIKLWDTEMGKVINTFSNRKVPYVVKFHPDDDKQNVILAGCSDKKIVQWDTNTGEITQEYDQHLGAVNTITFVDENRRFVTSSDDKSLRVWEFGIPVVIKYISEPTMHSMPAIAVHPNANWMACQSLDNTIVVYSTKDRFRLNHKKKFMGHLNAGYAIQVNFSPDGRFVMSGDADGRCFFWDWKTCKNFKTLKCHDGVCFGVEWHPLEQSKVATCGWDGLIKYWD